MRTQSSRFGHATWLLVLLVFAPANSLAIQVPSFSLRRPPHTTVAGLEWHTQYAAAQREAKRRGRMLLVNFVPPGDDRAQREFEQELANDDELRAKLKQLTLLRVPHDAKIGKRGRRRRLLKDPAFEHLGGRPGLAIIDYQHRDEPYYGRVVTALPFADGKYYRWQPSHLAVALDLPPGTITQRTMVWAVRIHPESPESTAGRQHPALVAAAKRHSRYQARLGVQGHHRWDQRFHEVRAAADASQASEVVAESWPDQDLIDSCIDCVRSWRHSSGHWRSVSGRQRLFGYDIRRGRNGIWYATGIFAN